MQYAWGTPCWAVWMTIEAASPPISCSMTSLFEPTHRSSSAKRKNSFCFVSCKSDESSWRIVCISSCARESAEKTESGELMKRRRTCIWSEGHSENSSENTLAGRNRANLERHDMTSGNGGRKSHWRWKCTSANTQRAGNDYPQKAAFHSAWAQCGPVLERENRPQKFCCISLWVPSEHEVNVGITSIHMLNYLRDNPRAHTMTYKNNFELRMKSSVEAIDGFNDSFDLRLQTGLTPWNGSNIRTMPEKRMCEYCERVWAGVVDMRQKRSIEFTKPRIAWNNAKFELKTSRTHLRLMCTWHE